MDLHVNLVYSCFISFRCQWYSSKFCFGHKSRLIRRDLIEGLMEFCSSLGAYFPKNENYKCSVPIFQPFCILPPKQKKYNLKTSNCFLRNEYSYLSLSSTKSIFFHPYAIQRQCNLVVTWITNNLQVTTTYSNLKCTETLFRETTTSVKDFYNTFPIKTIVY